MQNSLPKKIQSYMEEHSRFRRWSKLVTVLACVVVFCTTYALILPAITMTSETYCGKEEHTHTEECYERELICTLGSDEDVHEHTDACYETQLVLVCGLEEGPEHTHTADCCLPESVLVCTEGEGASGGGTHQHRDTCYKETLICDKEEHQHSLLCYSNPEADLETADVWERTVPTALSGDWAADLISVAESQLGYHESTNNYILDEGGYIHGYTRYGAWYGSPYGDWCAMFVSFCLNYAGIPESAFPYEAGCTRWVELLTQAGLYAADAPEAGDLVFFDKNADGLADHVGIVTAVSGDAFQTIEGNLGKAVVSQTHSLTDGEILGYGLLPSPSEEPEKPDEAEKQPLCGLEEHTHDEGCYDAEGNLTCTHEEHTHTDACYEEARKPLCGLEEHTHDEGCFDAEGNLTCTREEHVHTDACYEEARKPLCGLEEHTHDENCYDAEGNLTCTREEHVHTDACYEEAKKPLCGLEEHTHDEGCYDAEGNLTCTREEHTHTDACYQAAGSETYEFSYADSQLSLRLYVESPVSLENAELQVIPVSRSTAQLTEMLRTANMADEEEPDTSGEWILRHLALTQDGETLDTSAFTMTADITLTRSALAPVEAKLAALSTLADAAPEAELAISISVMQEDAAQSLHALDSAAIAPGESSPVLHAAVQSGLVAVQATTANPTYTVQYYAWIPRFSTSGDKSLTVFDTSKEGNNSSKAVLPQNNRTNATKEIYLTKAGGTTKKNNGDETDLYKVATTDTLTQMYSDNLFEYIKAPNPSYTNKLIDNPHYQLKEIWVLRENGDSTSTDASNWTIYNDPSSVHFTNRKESLEDHPDLVYMSSEPGEGTVLRMVYTAETGDYTTQANFYDYDISSGLDGGQYKTGTAGINSPDNYTANGRTDWNSHRDLFAFGNDNCGTGLSRYLFAGVFLNKYSTYYLDGLDRHYISDYDQYGCTFGLVSGLQDGKIVYNEWLMVPNLFNDGTVKSGKHTYDSSSGSSLTFAKVGDTYTLSAATVGNGVGTISDLQHFFNPSPTENTIHSHIFTNDFWPLDNAQDKTDPLFGAYDINTYFVGYKPDSVVNQDGSQKSNPHWETAYGSFPGSDDGKAHNSFFGMQYAVDFTLTEDYVGPLEYYFFGDDDMWVFLDNTLVCDIGGVHSSVGEYVNLWDYLEKGTAGPHRLSFFYTERGASGSTCYMNFTLPSVSGVTLPQTTGDLTVKKEVVGESDSTRDFKFEIHFYDAKGGEILDDYSYSKTDREGKITDDLILHEGSEFTLKAGESIHVKYLPIGLRYVIREKDSTGYTVTNTVNGVVNSGETATGTVIKDLKSEVVFTNTIGRVGLTLQKLDQDGSPLNGAVFQLTGSDDKTISFQKDADGNYSVPVTASDLVVDQQEYYIAYAADPSWVLGQNLDSNTQYRAQLQKKSDINAQKFKVYRQADGSYSFQSLANGKWLDLDQGNLADEHMVHFWDNANTPTSEDNQKWFLIVSGGTVKIKPRVAVLEKSKAVLDLYGNETVEGKNINVHEDNGTDAQKWLLVPVDPAAAPETTDQLEVTSGGIRLDGLMPGNYTLKEVTAPVGFKQLDDPVELHVDANGKITLLDGSTSLASVDKSGLILSVRNTPTDKKLTLRKLVTNSKTTQKFDFTVSYKLDDKAVEQKLSLANGSEGTLDIPYGAKVTISEPKHDGFTLTFTQNNTTLDSDGTSCTIEMTQDVTIVATNEAGYALPETGGAGTIWFTIGGLLLITGSLLYGCTQRRRRERRNI